MKNMCLNWIFLVLMNLIPLFVCSEDTYFVFHLGYWCCHGYGSDGSRWMTGILTRMLHAVCYFRFLIFLVVHCHAIKDNLTTVDRVKKLWRYKRYKKKTYKLQVCTFSQTWNNCWNIIFAHLLNSHVGVPWRYTSMAARKLCKHLDGYLCNWLFALIKLASKHFSYTLTSKMAKNHNSPFRLNHSELYVMHHHNSEN